MLISKKISWASLILFISFDNIFSYFAITEYGMREWNRISGYFVSINPLYYFISIPLTIFFIYAIVKFAAWIEEKTDKRKKFTKETNEKILLGCLMIGWGIGNTLFNFITFVKGFRNISIEYEFFLAAGIILAAIYGIYSSWKINMNKKRERSKAD